jgi:hypothetical protein
VASSGCIFMLRIRSGGEAGEIHRLAQPTANELLTRGLSVKREDEPEEFAIADLYFDEIRSWLKFRDSHDPWMAAPGSLIASDDQLTQVFRASFTHVVHRHVLIRLPL